MDPLVDETLDPYGYAGEDPANADDPLGWAKTAPWKHLRDIAKRRPLTAAECNELNQSIQNQLDLVQKRYREMAEDGLQQFTDDPIPSNTTAAGHIYALNQAQEGLHQRIDAWDQGNCDDSGGSPLPQGAKGWAAVPPPKYQPYAPFVITPPPGLSFRLTPKETAGGIIGGVVAFFGGLAWWATQG